MDANVNKLWTKCKSAIANLHFWNMNFLLNLLVKLFFSNYSCDNKYNHTDNKINPQRSKHPNLWPSDTACEFQNYKNQSKNSEKWGASGLCSLCSSSVSVDSFHNINSFPLWGFIFKRLSQPLVFQLT